MEDTKKFEHGEEGTHHCCQKRLREEGGKARCCTCVPHEGCELSTTQPQNASIPNGSVSAVPPPPTQEDTTWEEFIDKIWERGHIPDFARDVKHSIKSEGRRNISLAHQQGIEEGRREDIESIKRLSAERDTPKSHPLVSFQDVCNEIIASLTTPKDK